MIKRWFDKKYINFLYFNEISDLPLAKTHRIFWKILQKVEKSWEKPTLPLNAQLFIQFFFNGDKKNSDNFF